MRPVRWINTIVAGILPATGVILTGASLSLLADPGRQSILGLSLQLVP